jgi:hypothetical protein
VSAPDPRGAREEAARLLRRNKPARDVAAVCGLDPAEVAVLRQELGLGPRALPSVEDAWRARVEELPGGHMRWAGAYSGTQAVLWYRGKNYQATRIAFRLRHGREPQGKVTVECDVSGCVAPACVDDLPGRLRDRAAMAAVTGRPAAPKRCVRGHDQAVHGRRYAQGRPYCGACVRLRDPGRIRGADDP